MARAACRNSRSKSSVCRRYGPVHSWVQRNIWCARSLSWQSTVLQTVSHSFKAQDKKGKTYPCIWLRWTSLRNFKSRGWPLDIKSFSTAPWSLLPENFDRFEPNALLRTDRYFEKISPERTLYCCIHSSKVMSKLTNISTIRPPVLVPTAASKMSCGFNVGWVSDKTPRRTSSCVTKTSKHRSINSEERPRTPPPSKTD